MKNKEYVINKCKKLSVDEISYIIEQLQYLQRDKFESLYKTINIYPGEIIVDKIKKETGFECYHESCKGYSMGRGTHVIVIPIEKYTDDLKKELIEKYDDKYD